MVNQGQFNPAQMQQQQAQHQQMQGMQNGQMRNASPATLQNPAYQTNSVIPSKRPRPPDDNVGGSPMQNPNMLPTSRSQTPQQQNFPGGFPQQNAGQFPHLQPNGSANASPSPIMNNQMRPGSVPQRVATASPHPYSPSNQQFGNQTSPVQSEHGTPQPNQFMQNMPQGFNPSNFQQSPSNARPSPNPNAMAGGQMMPQQMGQMPQQMSNMYAHMQQQQQQQQQQHQPQQQHQQQPGQQQHPQQPPQHQQMGMQQQRPQGTPDQNQMANYQMRLQQQLKGNMQMQSQMQAQQQMGRGMMPNQKPQGMPNGQGQPGQQGMMRPRPMVNPNPEQFMKNLTALMNARGMPLDTNPMIDNRPVNLMMLFQAVQNKGGYKAVTTGNGWPYIAQALGLPPQQPNVPPMLKQIYERNLYKFEEVWLQQQHKQRMMQQQQQQQQHQAQQQAQQAQHQAQQQQQQQQQQHQAQQQGTPQKQMPPNQHMNQGQMPQGQQPNVQQQTPVKPGHPPLNGMATPQQQHQQVPGHNRNSLSRGLETPAQSEFAMPSPAHTKSGSMSMPQPDGRPSTAATTQAPVSKMLPKSDEYEPCAREFTSHGGVDINGMMNLGAELARWEPDVPPLPELGNIDIHALTKSIQSGIHGEVRLALDTLATVSNSPHHQHHFIRLPFCDDLVDTLIDCAEEQLDVLAEHTVEVSDEVQLTSYEELVRSCRLEGWAVKETPAFGTDEYNLDRAVDRLICITTILRNVSFPGDQNENHAVLADEAVIKFLCTVIRYIGTRTMLLRTHANTLDFMKDVVILLSNISPQIEIPGREQALCLLTFLISFAPAPGPSRRGDAWSFPPYQPSLHPYLPHAVDALAKLFARDEPNRTHFRALFHLDAASTPSYELLTRTFALAISPIPDEYLERLRPKEYPNLIDVRKPFLMQGLLCAEMIASIAPGPESGLTRSWLSSDNSLAHNLMMFISKLSRIYEQPTPMRGHARAAPRKDPELVYIVVTAVSLLRRLSEKAHDPTDPSSTSLAFLPSSQKLLEITSLTAPEWAKEGLLQQFTTCFNLSR